MAQGSGGRGGTTRAGGGGWGDSHQQMYEPPVVDLVGAALQLFSEGCNEGMLKDMISNILQGSAALNPARENQKRKIDGNARGCLERSLQSLEAERRVSGDLSRALRSYFL